MPKGDPAGYLPNVVKSRKKKKKSEKDMKGIPYPKKKKK